MLQGVDECPTPATLEIHKCAGQGVNYSDCCLKKNITKACLQFCDTVNHLFSINFKNLVLDTKIL
jgi:hypothetical protein